MVNRLIAFIKKDKKRNNAYEEDLLDKRGREQLIVMTERGLDLPIVLLN